jgi:acetyl esterase
LIEKRELIMECRDEDNDPRKASSTACAGPDSQRISGMAVREIKVLGRLAARLFAPVRVRRAGGLIVLFPCGGFVASDLEHSNAFAGLLAERTGCTVLVCSYTPAVVSPFPAAAEDAYAALAWAVRNRARLGWNGEQLIVAGVEAGGNLAAVSAMMARDRGRPALSAQLLIMPMLDPGLTSCSMRAASRESGSARAAMDCAAGYRGYLPRAADRVHPYASPLQSSRMRNLPPALILSADADPLRDEAEQYGARLAAAGITTLVRRLPPIALAQPDARCTCVRQESVLREIAAFIAGLEQPARGERS